MNILKRFINFYQHQDSILFWATSTSILLALFLTILFLSTLDQLPNQIPLFFSLPWGDNQLAQKNQFAILPALIILITLGNLIITWHLHTSQLTIKRIILLSTTVLSVFTFVAGMHIIYTIL